MVTAVMNNHLFEADPEVDIEDEAAALAGSRNVADARVTDFIGDKAMLLVLDNVEHLVDDVAALVPKLLVACPNTAVLCTSREPLNSQGEIVYRVTPLAWCTINIWSKSRDKCVGF